MDIVPESRADETPFGVCVQRVRLLVRQPARAQHAQVHDAQECGGESLLDFKKCAYYGLMCKSPSNHWARQRFSIY